MRVVSPEQLDWQNAEGYARAEVHSETAGGQTVRVEMLEVAPGAVLPPHRHKKRREFLCVVYAGGAQLRIGDRVFRPLAGQTFEREPDEILEVVNDTGHPLRVLITQLGYDQGDVQPG